MVDGHRATVLVVDDEAFVRMDLVDTLKAAGLSDARSGLRGGGYRNTRAGS